MTANGVVMEQQTGAPVPCKHCEPRGRGSWHYCAVRGRQVTPRIDCGEDCEHRPLSDDERERRRAEAMERWAAERQQREGGHQMAETAEATANGNSQDGQDEGRGNGKRIKWDLPAGNVVAGAPKHLPLWSWAEKQHEGGVTWEVIGEQLGLNGASIGQCVRKWRAKRYDDAKGGLTPDPSPSGANGAPSGEGRTATDEPAAAAEHGEAMTGTVMPQTDDEIGEGDPFVDEVEDRELRPGGVVSMSMEKALMLNYLESRDLLADFGRYCLLGA